MSGLENYKVKNGASLRAFLLALCVLAVVFTLAHAVFEPSVNLEVDPSKHYWAHIVHASKTHKLDPYLVWAVIYTESAFNPTARSPKGALGLMQIMPDTGKMLGIKNFYNPRENITAGSKYLGTLLNDNQGNLNLALAAYNAGPAAVQKYSGVPPYWETRNYVRKVLRAYRAVKKSNL